MPLLFDLPFPISFIFSVLVACVVVGGWVMWDEAKGRIGKLLVIVFAVIGFLFLWGLCCYPSFLSFPFLQEDGIPAMKDCFYSPEECKGAKEL